MLSDFLEASALVKTLDFLLDEWEADFSQADISRETGLNWKTVHLLMPKLEFAGLVIPTRTISRARMYRVGKDSAAFKAFKKLDRCLNAQIIKEEAPALVEAKVRSRR